MIEGAREELRAAARDLKSIRYRMLGVHASITPSPQETSRGDLAGEMDVETEIRNVIACGIQDGLNPLIDDWLNAANYQPKRGEAAVDTEGGSPSIAHLDLSVFSEETRQALHDLVVVENFSRTELSRSLRTRALNGHFELTVEAAGFLTLPAEVTRGLRVVPGDLFFLHVERGI